MKKTLILLVALLTAAMSSAQQIEVEIPALTSIEVDAEGVPVLKWTMQHPELVDGYIIKRLIVDGQGVISGTFNNVAIIEDNHTFTYTDRSNEYGTYAMTSVRKETYCLAAYHTDENGKIHYSLMSDPSSTIMAQGEYNFCDKTYVLQYSATDNAKSYTIHQLEPEQTQHAAGKDTAATLSFDTFHKTRRFQIECTATNGISTFSPIIEIEASEPVPPQTVEIELVTVNDSQQIELTLNASSSQSSGNAWLMRHDIKSGVDSTLQLSDNIMSGFVLTDFYADPDTRYSYMLAIDDKCGRPLAHSDSAYNIVATVNDIGTNTNLVAWNMPSPTDNITGSQIFRKINGQEWQQTGEASRFDNEYQDHLSNMIADENIYDGNFCYQITINNQNGKAARSNIACIQREPVIYIPNALNPSARNSDDWTFRPRADFLNDYHLTIYDKRGAVIFQSDDINNGWDGRDRTSKLCHRDTYIYYITFKTSSGKTIEKTGMVNLIY